MNSLISKRFAAMTGVPILRWRNLCTGAAWNKLPCSASVEFSKGREPTGGGRGQRRSLASALHP
jgi:hypothetical protein